MYDSVVFLQPVNYRNPICTGSSKLTNGVRPGEARLLAIVFPDRLIRYATFSLNTAIT